MRALRLAAHPERWVARLGWRVTDCRAKLRFSVRRLTRWRAARRTLLCRGEQLETRRLLSLLGECDPADFVEVGAVAGAASAAALVAPEYDPENIIVRFRPDGATVSAPEALTSASEDREFPLVSGLRAVKLDVGASVERALEAYRARPDVLYAATWEKARAPWNFLESGPGSGVWKSGDAGRTWGSLFDREAAPASGPWRWPPATPR